MPIKSKAQRRKFAELLVEGKISPETFEEWNRGAGSAELPERLHPKAAKPKRTKLKRTKLKRTSRAKTAARSKTARTKKGGRPARKHR
jgi:hypothetical protein